MLSYHKTPPNLWGVAGGLTNPAHGQLGIRGGALAGDTLARLVVSGNPAGNRISATRRPGWPASACGRERRGGSVSAAKSRISLFGRRLLDLLYSRTEVFPEFVVGRSPAADLKGDLAVIHKVKLWGAGKIQPFPSLDVRFIV